MESHLSCGGTLRVHAVLLRRNRFIRFVPVVRVPQVRYGEKHRPVRTQAGTANVRVVPPAHKSKRKAEATHVHVQFQLVVCPVGLCVHSSLAVRLCVSWLKTAGSNYVAFRPEECFQLDVPYRAEWSQTTRWSSLSLEARARFACQKSTICFFRGSPSLALP